MSGKRTPRRRFTRGDGKGLVFTLATVGGGVFLARASHSAGHPGPGPSFPSSAMAAPADTTWSVGELRPDGLRIVPSGRSDAADVLDTDEFERTEVHEAYRIATRIPDTLNQLYCCCGCEDRGVHRSNLGCFEDEMGVNCDVCRGTAEIAWEMVQNGVTDAAKIQAAVDASWAPRDRRGA